jgi:hypothetical protein
MSIGSYFREKTFLIVPQEMKWTSQMLSAVQCKFSALKTLSLLEAHEIPFSTTQSKITTTTKKAESYALNIELHFSIHISFIS